MTDPAKTNVSQRLREIFQTNGCSYAEFARLLSIAGSQLSRHIPGKILGDPARAILFEIFIANEEGRPCSMKEAYLASGAPQSTAVRYIDYLVKDGQVATSADLTDRRRVLLNVTSKTSEGVKAYLRAIAPFPLVSDMK